MKYDFGRPESQVGSVINYDGNSDVGTGKLEIIKIVRNQEVDITLTMIKPFHGLNNIVYTLIPDAGGTRFIWTMSGDGGQFETGIANLKAIMENQK